jgi:hypothetical protein
MSWVPAEQVLATVTSQRQVLAEQQARISTAAQSHATERQKLDSERAQAVQDLGQAVLPVLDRSTIATAARTVGLVGLPNEDIPGRLETRRAWLVARLREIQKDPRYANAELLRHPRTGSLTTAIAEAEEMRKPASEVVATCDGHLRFERLYETGFDTPEDKGAWWRYSHWVDRSAAQEIVALFPGKTRFAELRDDYQRCKETLATYDAELVRLRAEVAAGEAAEREYRTLYHEHQHLDAQALEYARGRLTGHMLTSDASLVSQRLESSSALRLLFLRASGLTAKLSYLDGIHRANITEMQRDLTTMQQRLDGVETRTRKRWAPMPLDKYQKLAEDRRPRYEKRWQRYDKVYTTVYSYDRYDRGSRYDDLLWWDVMTRGRYDGSYVPEVAEFHRVHPDYQFDPSLLQAHATQFVQDPSDGLSGAEEADAAATAISTDANQEDALDTRTTDAS